MKNHYLTQADFWQERDFGAKITAMFEFLKEHWRPLGKCLVYFALPPTLLLGIGMGTFTNTMYNRMGAVAHGGRAAAERFTSPLAGFSLTGGVLAFVGGLLAALLLVSTVYGYLRARLRLPATEPVTPALVWAAIRERVGSMLLSILVFVAAYVLLAGGVGVVVGVLAGQGGALRTSVPIMVLGVFGIFFLVTYLAVVLSLYFPVLWLEDGSVFAAIGRCFQLIKGRWWATFGLVLVTLLLQSAISIVFAIPQYAVLVGKMMQLPYLGADSLGLLTQTLYSVGLIFMYPVLLVTLAFQYFNLAEQREGHGLRLLMDGLGQATPEAASHHYRPEEEQY